MILILTTDPQKEVFDVVNEKDEVVGNALRSEVHQDKSLIHRSVAVLVFQNDRLYLQRRSKTKDTYAGYWTCSCSGHVDTGETYKDAAKRELSEELGLQIDAPLLFLKKKIIRYPAETEYISFFRYNTSAKIVVNATEISEGKFFEFDRQFIDVDLPSLNVTPCLRYICECLIKESSKTSNRWSHGFQSP